MVYRLIVMAIALSCSGMNGAAAVDNTSHGLSHRFCFDISMLTACLQGERICDDVESSASAMARSTYYLGRVQASLEELIEKNLLRGEARVKYDEFVIFLAKAKWDAVSVDRNFLATVQEINSIFSEARRKVELAP